jgi:UDP-N-acetylglucosamine 2-epimerase (non-hydrolysing)
VAVKMLIPVAHVEAGLRSRDRTMPEEINRIVTDCVADVLLTPSPDAGENLLAEGVPAGKIHFVGNIMIDSLMQYLPIAQLARVRDRIPVEERGYAVLTLHRPSNVDDVDVFRRILAAVRTIAEQLPVVFPVHPRTRRRLREFGLDTAVGGVILTEPLGYIDFLSLTSHARLILTDSGGLQEESTALGIPCLTLRENTERPITVTHGTNEVVGSDTEAIRAGFWRAMNRNGPPPRPEMWDGHAAGRIAGVLCEFLAI